MVQLLGKKKSGSNLLSTFVMISLGLHLLTLLLLLFQGLTLNQLTNQKPPTLVQLIDGKESPIPEPLEREPEEIRSFVEKTMTALFTWSGKLPPQNIEEAQNPKPDEGVPIKMSTGVTKKISTTVLGTSFALSEDFRKQFLQEIANQTPPEVFSSDSKKAMEIKLATRWVSEPEKIEEGKWKAVMVADLILLRPALERRKLVRFNKEILVRAVDSPEHPLAEGAPPLHKVVSGTRQVGLEIYEIRDMCLTDKSNKLIDCPIERTN